MVIVFHWTRKENLEKIMKDGLKAGTSVTLTPSEAWTRYFGDEYGYGENLKEIVLLRMDVPEDMLKNLFSPECVDEETGEVLDKELRAVVPPDKIEVVPESEKEEIIELAKKHEEKLNEEFLLEVDSLINGRDPIKAFNHMFMEPLDSFISKTIKYFGGKRIHSQLMKLLDEFAKKLFQRNDVKFLDLIHDNCNGMLFRFGREVRVAFEDLGGCYGLRFKKSHPLIGEYGVAVCFEKEQLNKIISRDPRFLGRLTSSFETYSAKLEHTTNKFIQQYDMAIEFSHISRFKLITEPSQPKIHINISNPSEAIKYFERKLNASLEEFMEQFKNALTSKKDEKEALKI